MRDSFVFHTSCREYLRLLPSEQQLQIYDFLSDFAEADGNMELPNVDKPAFIVLKMITDRMIEDFRRYEEIRRERAEGGKKGGRPKKPKGLDDNLKVSEEPQGYSENLNKAKKPVSVSDYVSVSESDCVCEAEGALREGTGTHPTKEEAAAYYIELCRKRGIQQRPGWAEHFMKYSHKEWQREMETWVDDDIAKGAYTPTAVPGRTAGSICNFTQSGTDWNAVADQVIAAQNQEDESDDNELQFV